MGQTKQAAALAAANQFVAIAGQVKSLAEQIDALMKSDSAENYLATWALLQTAAVNADGSIGATDPTPVVSDPIILPTASPLYVSKNALANARQLCVDIQSLLGNVAVTAQNRCAWIDDALAGK
jgi:hypothetical protein